jgi:hypothetical protein
MLKCSVPITITNFDDIITEALASTPASTGDNLLGYDYDLFHALYQSHYFSHITTQRTSRQQSMLNAICKLRPRYRYKLDIVQALTSIWQKDVGYTHFRAHTSQHDGTRVIFRFVTTSGVTSQDLCVTGTITVLRATARPRRRKKRRYGRRA